MRSEISYVVSVQSTDSGGKYTAQTFDIEVLEDPNEAKVQVKVSYDTAAQGAGAAYQKALTTFTTDYTAFVQKASTFFQAVDVDMDAAYAQQQAPILNSYEQTQTGYKFTLGSFIYDIYDASPPTIADPFAPTEDEMAALLDPSNWAADKGVSQWELRKLLAQLLVNFPSKFRWDQIQHRYVALIDLNATAPGTDVDKIVFTGDFSNFSFDDFEVLCMPYLLNTLRNMVNMKCHPKVRWLKCLLKVKCLPKARWVKCQVPLQ